VSKIIMSQNLARYFSQTVLAASAGRRHWDCGNRCFRRGRPERIRRLPKCFDCSRPVSRRRCRSVQTPAAGLSTAVRVNATGSCASDRGGGLVILWPIPTRTRHRKYRLTRTWRRTRTAWPVTEGSRTRDWNPTENNRLWILGTETLI